MTIEEYAPSCPKYLGADGVAPFNDLGGSVSGFVEPTGWERAATLGICS